MISSILLLSACKLGANDPPKFKKFNGDDVNYLFGLAYVSLFEPEQVRAGERYEMDVEVSDPDGDRVELLVPGAPSGLTMDKHLHEGFWQVPEELWTDYFTVQLIAVDERGGSDALFLTFEVSGVELDTGLEPIVYHMLLDLPADASTAGRVELFNPMLDCSEIWTQVQALPIEACALCEHSWVLDARREEPLIEGQCERSWFTPHRLSVGWTRQTTIEGIPYNNALLLKSDAFGWSVFGGGTLRSNLLNASARILENSLTSE